MDLHPRAFFDESRRAVFFSNKYIRNCETLEMLAYRIPLYHLSHLLRIIFLVSWERERYNKTFYLVKCTGVEYGTLVIAPLRKGRKFHSNDYIRPYSVVYYNYLSLSKSYILGVFSDINTHPNCLVGKFDFWELWMLGEEWKVVYYRRVLIPMRYIDIESNVLSKFPMELLEMIIRFMIVHDIPHSRGGM